jgi:sulfhydrogenase subunit beta (sulfur reductase)
MANYFISDSEFMPFVQRMMEGNEVVAPTAKKSKFVFAKLESAEQLRLDYDVTILPPKKEFFPPCQKLVEFDCGKFTGCIDPKEKILFGVHFYDIKGIDMTDFLFEERNADMNYLANRRKATIIGSSIQTISERAFWGTVGTEVKAKGHDGFLTKISAGYTYETLTEKGEALVTYGKFEKASESQASEADRVNNDVMDKCQEKLNFSSKEIADKVRASFGNIELWEELAKDCFSCGSCNTTCPTCYCFDVQDDWNVDQKTGERKRYWDSCLTTDFAKISLGAGNTENFRTERGDRFRHRFMRKGTYLNEKLGGPACTGCGRCSLACTADIADPVHVYNRIMEA